MTGEVLVVVPPCRGVVRDYAGGLGFEPASDYVLPPLDLLQLAAVAALKRPVALLDFSWSDSPDACRAEVVARRPAAVIVQASVPTFQRDIAWAREVRRLGARVLVRVPSLVPGLAETVRPDYSDEWLVGECEPTLANILDGEHGHGFARGVPTSADLPQALPNLDVLPFPLRAVARRYPYAYPKLGECTTIQTSRGCPFGCAYYCPYPLTQGRTWRARSVPSVVAELREASDVHGYERVLFRDAVFTLDKARTRELSDALRGFTNRLTWWCETRADLLDERTVEAMVAAGCVGVNIGVESGDEPLRTSVLKGRVTDEIVERVCAMLGRSGMGVALLMMVGWPGETRDSLVKSAELITRCRPQAVGFVFPTAYPGTAFFDDMVRANAVARDDLPTAGHVPSVRSPTLSFEEMITGRALLERVVHAVNVSEEVATSLESVRAWARDEGV